jgi:excisionase family DNA binding protein
MPTSQFISVRETAQVLTVSEKKVMDLIEGGDLQAYRIADKFLRLKRADVLKLRNAGHVETDTNQVPYTSGERFRDFFYYNNFYLISSIFVLVLLYIIFYT